MCASGPQTCGQKTLLSNLFIYDHLTEWGDHIICHPTQSPAYICELIKYRIPSKLTTLVTLAFFLFLKYYSPCSKLRGFTLPVSSAWDAPFQYYITGLYSVGLISAITFLDLPWVVPAAPFSFILSCIVFKWLLLLEMTSLLFLCLPFTVVHRVSSVLLKTVG